MITQHTAMKDVQHFVCYTLKHPLWSREIMNYLIYLHIFHIAYVAYISCIAYIALTKSEMMLYILKYFSYIYIFFTYLSYIILYYIIYIYYILIYYQIFNKCNNIYNHIMKILEFIDVTIVMCYLIFDFLCCWFISAGDARMATGQSDAPWQPNTPGQPDATVGHRDLMTGVIDDFGNCQSQMMFHDWYDCQITDVWYFDNVIDVVMFDCLSNFLMWPYISDISVCNTLHFWV